MRFKHVKEAIVLTIKASQRRPQKAMTPLISGPPGTAKSALAYLVAEEMEMPVAALIRPGIKEPVDFSGIPVAIGDYTAWLKPDILRRMEKAGKSYIVLVDDYGQGLPATQAALAPLFLPEPDGSRHIGEHRIPTGGMVIVTTNRKEDKSSVHAMPAYAKNRMIELPMEPHQDDIEDHMVKARFNAKVLTFHRNTGWKYHYTFNPKKPEDIGATWRGWDYVNGIENEFDHEACSLPVLRGLVTGSVGTAAGTEYMTFREFFEDLPSVKVILAGGKAKVPDKADRQYAITTLLGMAVLPSNVDAAFAWMENLPVEFQSLMWDDCIRRDAEIAKTKTRAVWLAKHGGTK